MAEVRGGYGSSLCLDAPFNIFILEQPSLDNGVHKGVRLQRVMITTGALKNFPVYFLA